ncbi:MAG: thiamine-binding protein [Balneolaceae bacterium]|nr:thiamine-binding protein [Balneolaceae bacterium]
MTTCQLTYLPFATEQVVKEVDEVVDFIDAFDVEYEVGDLSTTVRGERDEVLRLVTEMFISRDDARKKFRLHVELLSEH